MVRLELGGSLAQGMEPGERTPRQGTADAESPRSVELELGDGTVVAARVESQLRVEVVACERPGEQLRGSDGAHEEHPARRRASQQSRPVRRDDLPARALGEPAPVRLHRSDARPPVSEVTWLCDERPDIVTRR